MSGNIGSTSVTSNKYVYNRICPVSVRGSKVRLVVSEFFFELRFSKISKIFVKITLSLLMFSEYASSRRFRVCRVTVFVF